MCVSKSSLTVYFDPPFWVGLFQREDGNSCRVCKVTFGGEPRDQEILDWLLRHWHELRFSPPVPASRTAVHLPDPKRMRREARKATQTTGTGTKAQQALQREQMKTERDVISKARREEERERKLAIRQEKRRQKHRGH